MCSIASFETVEAFEAFWSQVPDLIEIEMHPINEE